MKITIHYIHDNIQKKIYFAVPIQGDLTDAFAAIFKTQIINGVILIIINNSSQWEEDKQK